MKRLKQKDINGRTGGECAGQELTKEELAQYRELAQFREFMISIREKPRHHVTKEELAQFQEFMIRGGGMKRLKKKGGSVMGGRCVEQEQHQYVTKEEMVKRGMFRRPTE